jgi:hypothetical protein
VVRSEIEALGFRITLWESSALPSRVSQDTSLVIPRSSTLRIGVVDGRTQVEDAPLVLGCDLGIHAAQIVRHALYGRGTMDQALEEANAFLNAEQDSSRLAFPEATCVVADVDVEKAAFVQAGDAEAWVFAAGEWRPIFPEGAMTGEAAELDRQWYRENAGLDITDLLRQERAREYVNVESAWRTAALGRFERPKLARMHVRKWDALLLASDGARLNPERIQRLEEWLVGLRSWESTQHRGTGILAHKPHDDVTVLRIERG